MKKDVKILSKCGESVMHTALLTKFVAARALGTDRRTLQRQRDPSHFN